MASQPSCPDQGGKPTYGLQVRDSIRAIHGLLSPNCQVIKVDDRIRLCPETYLPGLRKGVVLDVVQLLIVEGDREEVAADLDTQFVPGIARHLVLDAVGLGWSSFR